jgi:hypothetical protein
MQIERHASSAGRDNKFLSSRRAAGRTFFFVLTDEISGFHKLKHFSLNLRSASLFFRQPGSRHSRGDRERRIKKGN